jgi:hypothetical protein
VDNVSLAQQTGISTTQTNCIEPLASAPLGGADGPNMIRNGSFTSNQLAPWFQYGRVTQAVANGALSFYPSPGSPAGVVSQYTSVAAGANMPIEARFSLSNASPVRKRVIVLLHDSNFSDIIVCAFWLPANMPYGRFVMRGRTTQAWANASIAFYSAPADNIGWIRLDEVSMRTRPGLTVNGTNCYRPGSGVADEIVMDFEAEAALIAPTIEPTATPLVDGAAPIEAAPLTTEMPILITPMPTTPPSEAPPEGLYTEVSIAVPVTGGEVVPPAETGGEVPATPLPAEGG